MKKDTSHKLVKVGLTFSKSLAIFYDKWYKDALDSIAYCELKGQTKRADDYRHEAEQFKKIIDENREAIDFFKEGNNAFTLDFYLPEKFRGYK